MMNFNPKATPPDPLSNTFVKDRTNFVSDSRERAGWRGNGSPLWPLRKFGVLMSRRMLHDSLDGGRILPLSTRTYVVLRRLLVL